MNKIQLWAEGGCLLTLIVFAVVSGAQPGAARTEQSDVAELRQQFKAELTGLRVELLEQGLEFQRWKIAQLDRELQRVEAETRQLDEAEQGIFRQLAEVEQSIEPAAGESETHGEQTGMKAQLTGPRLRGVQTKRQPLLAQADDLRGQLRQEREHEQELVKKLTQLKSATATDPGRPEK